MSGEKQVILNEREYDRLMRGCKKSEDQQQMNQNLQNQLGQARTNADNIRRQGEQRHAAYQQTTNKLSQEIRSNAQQFGRQLAEQSAQFSRDFNSLDQKVNRNRQEYLNLISAQSQRFDQALENQRQALNEQIRQIDQRIKNKELNAKQSAQQWLNDAQAVIDYIEQNYRHQKFKPNAWQNLANQLEMAKSNIQQGHYEAAIATGQAVYANASDLHAKLEFLEQEWNAYYNLAQTSARTALAQCDTQFSALFTLDTEEGEQEMDAEIDYWSDGQLTALKSEVEQIISTLDNRRDEHTVDDIKGFIQSSTDHQSRLNEVVELAKHTLISSQLRQNIAQDILEALADRGWELTDNAWQGEEVDNGKGYKGSFHLKLEDIGGSELITVVMPEASAQGEINNRLQFSYFPKDNNDARFAQLQTQNIQEVLAELSLCPQNTRLGCVPGYENKHVGNKQRLDFDNVRRTQKTKT